MQEIKIFDIVLLFNEYEFLEARIKHLENQVSKFLIFDFGTGCKNFSSNNVIHIKASKEFLSKDFDLIYEAIKFLDPKSLYVQDLLIFSKVNEIPEIELIKQNSKHLNLFPIMLKQRKIFWEIDKTSSQVHFSSFVMNYSQFLGNRKNYDWVFEPKLPIPTNHPTIECGWQLNGFQEKNDLVSSYAFWNSIVHDTRHFESLHSSLLDFDSNVLQEKLTGVPQEFARLSVYVEPRQAKEVNITLDEDFFSKSKTQTLLVKKGCIMVNDDANSKHSFEIPHTEYYQTNDWALNFSKNETLRVLQKLSLLPHDIIILDKKETPGRMSYQEFQKIVPSDLI